MTTEVIDQRESVSCLRQFCFRGARLLVYCVKALRPRSVRIRSVFSEPSDRLLSSFRIRPSSISPSTFRSNSAWLGGLTVANIATIPSAPASSRVQTMSRCNGESFRRRGITFLWIRSGFAGSRVPRLFSDVCRAVDRLKPREGFLDIGPRQARRVRVGLANVTVEVQGLLSRPLLFRCELHWPLLRIHNTHWTPIHTHKVVSICYAIGASLWNQLFLKLNRTAPQPIRFRFGTRRSQIFPTTHNACQYNTRDAGFTQSA